MTDVQWEEPPARKCNARKDWASIAAQLRSRPGQWAVIDTDAAVSAAANFRRGVNRSFPVGDFEFRAHGTNNNRVEKIYARFVGAVAS